jgi:hypothetical protein
MQIEDTTNNGSSPFYYEMSNQPSAGTRKPSLRAFNAYEQLEEDVEDIDVVEKVRTFTCLVMTFNRSHGVNSVYSKL